MRQFCVFGNPINHSLSPLMHNYTFKILEKELGFKGIYGRFLLQDQKKLRQKFFDLQLSGANITLPFKEEAYLRSDVVVGIAKKIKAVNTWVLRNNSIYGYNTDAMGFYHTIKDLNLSKVLILGAGGSAKAIAYILKEYQKEVRILNRSVARFQSWSKDFICYLPESIDDFNFDMVINTTSAGLNNILPFNEKILSKIFATTHYAYDLVYGKKTPFLEFASTCKQKTLDGREMLIAQGALAFELFCNKELPEALRIMQRALT